MIIDDSRNGGSFELKPAENFEIVLNENPTTGYRWRLESDGKPYVLALDDSFEPGGSPGAPGQHRWEFQAHQPGEARLVLWYLRSWEQKPTRSFSVTIRVDADHPLPGVRAE